MSERLRNALQAAGFAPEFSYLNAAMIQHLSKIGEIDEKGIFICRIPTPGLAKNDIIVEIAQSANLSNAVHWHGTLSAIMETGILNEMYKTSFGVSLMRVVA